MGDTTEVIKKTKQKQNKNKQVKAPKKKLTQIAICDI
jgi:hypothetical protein